MHQASTMRPDPAEVRGAGPLIRMWRLRRRMSQLQFALEAEISQRHLSFLESGRSAPSRAMLVRLADRLEVPLREQNAMLRAAGYAPFYAERSLEDPALSAARQAIERVLEGHEPYPALAVDRHWNLLRANRALGSLLTGVTDRSLLDPPVNVLRLGLHPNGIAPHIANLAEWRGHLLERLRHQFAITGDAVLAGLLRELSAYPPVAGAVSSPALTGAAPAPGSADVFVPLKLMTEAGLLTFFSTMTVFGTPADVTLAEIALEAFFPADAATKERLSELAAHNSAPGPSGA